MEAFKERSQLIQFFIGLGLVGLLTGSRFLELPANFSATTAVIVFSAVYFRQIISKIAVPALALFISDLWLGFSSIHGVVYLSYLLIGLLGFYMLRRNRGPMKLLGTAFLASGLFFLLTNFGVWLWSGIYTHSFSGLVLCFEMALPFYRNMIAGDLFFLFAVFYAGEVIQRLCLPKRARFPLFS